MGLCGNFTVVTLFCRATRKAMNDNLKANLEHSPDQVVLYVGSNNLKLNNCCKMIHPTPPPLYLSLAGDEFNGAVKDANKHLKIYCRQNGWKLIQHLKITENGLNKGGLYLSCKGNQNIFLTALTCSPQISCVLSVLNPTVNPV